MTDSCKHAVFHLTYKKRYNSYYEGGTVCCLTYPAANTKLCNKQNHPAHTEISLLFPEGRPLHLSLGLGLQRLLLARHLVPVSYQHLVRARAPASQMLPALDPCQQRCFQLALSLHLLPSALRQAALSPLCLDSSRANNRVLAPAPPVLVSVDHPLPFWSLVGIHESASEV